MLVDEDINIDFKIGDEAHHLVGVEKEENKVSLKNMISGDQELINATEIFNKVTNE